MSLCAFSQVQLLGTGNVLTNFVAAGNENGTMERIGEFAR